MPEAEDRLRWYTKFRKPILPLRPSNRVWNRNMEFFHCGIESFNAALLYRKTFDKPNSLHREQELLIYCINNIPLFVPLREMDWSYSNKRKHNRSWFNCFLFYFQFKKKHWHRFLSNQYNSCGAWCLISIVSLRRCYESSFDKHLWCACEDRMESCFFLRCAVVKV